jgi:hypothetical protein
MKMSKSFHERSVVTTRLADGEEMQVAVNGREGSSKNYEEEVNY